VSKLRESVTSNVISEKASDRTYTTKHGTTARMRTENIGRRQEDSAEPLASEEDSELEADKRRAVMKLLNDDEWSQWSDREIARRCAVSHMTVNRLREEMSLSQSYSEPVEPRTYTTKHGTTATMRGVKTPYKKKNSKKFL